MAAIVPWKRLEIDTDLELQEILPIIRNSIAPLKWSLRGSNPFMGVVDKTGFMIMPSLYVSATVLPAAYGRFFNIYGKVHISVIISFHPFAIITTPLLALGAGIFLIVISVLFSINPMLVLIAYISVCIYVYICIMRYYDAEQKKLAEFLFSILKSKQPL